MPSPVPESPSPGGTASLSGFVYLDASPDTNKMTNADWAILGAEIALTRDNDPPLIVYSKQDGSYSLSGLFPGTYTVTLLTPSPSPGTDTLGEVFDENGQVVSTGTGTVGQNQFSSIQILDGYTAKDYNFTELVFPISLINKRMLLNDSPPILHTVPEPGSLALLAIGGLVFVGLMRRRVAG